MATNPRTKGDGWIGVDFDGTLAHYDYFRGRDHVGAPVEEMVKRVRKWLAEGRDVRLFTARTPSPALRRWMKEHLGEILPITNTKDSHMQALYDDRVVQVKRNKGTTHEDHERQVWQK
jgi:hypothetical protein